MFCVRESSVSFLSILNVFWQFHCLSRGLLWSIWRSTAKTLAPGSQRPKVQWPPSWVWKARLARRSLGGQHQLFYMGVGMFGLGFSMVFYCAHILYMLYMVGVCWFVLFRTWQIAFCWMLHGWVWNNTTSTLDIFGLVSLSLQIFSCVHWLCCIGRLQTRVAKWFLKHIFFGRSIAEFVWPCFIGKYHLTHF